MRAAPLLLVTLGVEGELDRPVAPDAAAVPFDQTFQHALNLGETFPLSPFARQARVKWARVRPDRIRACSRWISIHRDLPKSFSTLPEIEIFMQEGRSNVVDQFLKNIIDSNFWMPFGVMTLKLCRVADPPDVISLPVCRGVFEPERGVCDQFTNGYGFKY